MKTSIERAARTSAARVRRRDVVGQYSGGRGRLARPSEYAFLTGDPYPLVPFPATESEAMGLPPFGRGVTLLASSVAATDWYATRWDPDVGIDVRLADQPQVLRDPDPTVPPWNYRYAATEDLILYGNHFALYGDLDFRTLRPGWLVPLSASDVWLIVDPETGDFAFTISGEMIDADSMLHVSAGNRSGEVLGRGVLAQYGDWLGGAIAAETHAGAYFAGGTLPPAVLQSPTIVTQQQADELKAKWRTMTSTREPVILPNGYVLTPVVSNAEQAQLVESRTWNSQAVAMLLGIPSYKLGLSGASMTYQNIESADIEFVRDSIDRYARPLSDSFTKWLLPNGTQVAWNYAGRMRADQTTTSTVLATNIGSGVLTVDEARAVIGRPPVEQDTAVENETPEGVPSLPTDEVPS